ncbi:MAG: hypothetical protein JST26_04785 [Bacteroidetes bacterium]|nr:hypothetical protein [Bacteroidota bacterium]
MQKTKYNAKSLAAMYNLSYRTFFYYLKPHRKALEELATIREHKGKKIISPTYNSHQLRYIIEMVFKDTPEGYGFNGNYFYKLD